MGRQAASLRVSSSVLIYGPILLILGLLAVHVLGAWQDFAAAIASPLEIDYGEGIVWQQAVLIPGPSMYSRSQSLPFIVFHYPPLFHLITRALAYVMPSVLAAGRLVSVMSTLSISVCVAATVGVAVRVPGQPYSLTDLLAMAIAAMLLLCLHAVHVWGMVMRVDATAIAFAMAGVLVGAAGNGRFAPTLIGLLLCLCAVFTKQTQVSAGIALFLVTLLRNPRSALLAALIVGTIGLGALGLLQWITHGGFLLNIVGYNINRFSLQSFYNTYWAERSSLFVAIPALASIPVLLNPMRDSASGEQGCRVGLRARLIARLANRAVACRALLATYVFFSTCTLVMTFKSGSNFNYLFEWLVVACAIVGVALADLAWGAVGRRGSAGLLALLMPILVYLVFMPARLATYLHDPNALALSQELVERIASASKPVASDNMTLLMQAGKRVIYEPAIVTELAETGLWDEAPLVNMIQAHGFAFIITAGDAQVQASRRTVAVKAAIEAAYPKVEQLGPQIWVNLPPA
jgi:hypothetical protein